ncbi:NAD(P)-dependent oxidoreductase [Streptomyces sp. NBC_01198]|uniref:NAD(P)-dependent oxidoreductase n=1 Tax=Streptomyces sp. NBC_01198 TaxID=2903769 RepID=UPI002E1600C8|nr:NAD(P)H-binding protein [Streptomyces sp. NBC_01198]
MKLTVFGATGGTGRQIVLQAVDAGHEVTAVVRDATRLPAGLRDRIAVVETDPVDAVDRADVTAAVSGRDAVISAIGTRDLKHPTRVCTDAAGVLTAAIRSAGSRPRFVLASNSAMAPGAGDDPLTRFLVKPIVLAPLLRHMIEDMRQAEQVVRASGVPWTIVRAGRLTDGRSKGGYRCGIDRNVLGGFQITRADFATAMLDAATDPAQAGHVVSVGN